MRTFKTTGKLFRILLLTLTMSVCTACDPGWEDEVSFTPDDLVGLWRCTNVPGNELWLYRADGTGCTWNTADDVTQEEAQEFTWTLKVSTLTQLHQMEISGLEIPKVYTVTELDQYHMVYKDSYDIFYSFGRLTQQDGE